MANLTTKVSIEDLSLTTEELMTLLDRHFSQMYEADQEECNTRLEAMASQYGLTAPSIVDNLLDAFTTDEMVQYLKEHEELNEILDCADTETIVNYLTGERYTETILNNIGSDDIMDYMLDQMGSRDILGYIDGQEVMDYISDYDKDELLHSLDEEGKLKEYIQYNYDVYDFVKLDWE